MTKSKLNIQMHRDYNSTIAAPSTVNCSNSNALYGSDNHEVWCFDGFVLLPLTVQQLTVQLREESKRERERERERERREEKKGERVMAPHYVFLLPYSLYNQ